MSTSDVGNGFRRSEEAWPATMEEALPLTTGCSSGWSSVTAGTDGDRWCALRMVGSNDGCECDFELAGGSWLVYDCLLG